MSDELEDVILKTVRDRNCNRTESYMRGLREEATAIAAALRSRWPWIDWPCVWTAGLQDEEPFVTIYKTHIFIDYDNSKHPPEMIASDTCYYCGQPKPGPAPGDERGEDAEAIKMWRDK